VFVLAPDSPLQRVLNPPLVLFKHSYSPSQVQSQTANLCTSPMTSDQPGAIRGAKLQSNHHHQQTNTQHFTGRMPFLSPNQQCQSTEGRTSHSTDLFTPSSPGRLTTLSLTIKGSWLPWAGLPCPLTPAPPKSSIICPTNNYTRSHSNTMRYAVR